MTAYEVIPVEVGWREADTSMFLYLTGAGQPAKISYRLWVVRNGRQTILVDSGVPIDEARQRGVSDARDVEEALRSVSIDLREIEIVALTHLHWDHASNAVRFPRATFVAQQAELDALREPFRANPSIGRFYSEDVDKFHSLVDRGRFRLLKGDESIAEGLDALHVGGHTPGSQVVVVRTREGPAVICGDVIPLNRNYLDNIPNGIHIDVRQAIAAIERVRQLEPASLYAGHDPQSKLQLQSLESHS